MSLRAVHRLPFNWGQLTAGLESVKVTGVSQHQNSATVLLVQRTDAEVP